MPPAEMSRYSLSISADEGGSAAREALDELSRDLEAALAEAGVAGLDRLPDRTRGVELLAVINYGLTAVQTAEALAKVVHAIRACLRRYQRYRHRVRLRAGAVSVDVDAASEIEPIVAALLASVGRTGARRALIVANAEYEDPALGRLRGPTRDADALARVLGDPAVGGFEVDLLMDADERTVRRGIAAFFAGRDPDDLLFLHFSCHGVKDSRGRLHLAARDTELAVLGATGIPASFVHDQLDQTASRRVVLVLDCCYSGAFARGTSVRAERTVHVGEEFGVGSGRIVLTASSSTEYAFDGTDLTESEGQPSVFTTALVEGLATGEADLDGDGEISIDELYDYTYREVRRQTPGQTPMKWSLGVEGSLSVARSVRGATLPAQIVEDLASERVVLRLEAVSALAHLSAGRSPALADSARAALNRVAERDDSSQVRAAAAAALAPVAAPVAVPVAAPIVAQATAPVASQAPPPAPPNRQPPAPLASLPAASAAARPAGWTWPGAVAHPWVLSVVAFAGLYSLVQYVDMQVLGRDAHGFAGINALTVVPVVAAIAAVTAYRLRDMRWALGMALVFAVSVWLWVDPYVSRHAFRPDDAAWLAKAVSFGYVVNGTEEGDLLVRLVVGVPALLWYALFGPAAPARPRLRMRWVRRPVLLCVAVAALVLSLVGAQLVSGGYHGSDAVFHLILPAYRAQSYTSAIVGLGNVWTTYSTIPSIGSALWVIGWLVLVATALQAAGAALWRRQWPWLVAPLAGLAATIANGVTLEGFHSHADALGLAGGLALMTLTAGAGAAVAAWRPVPSR